MRVKFHFLERASLVFILSRSVYSLEQVTVDSYLRWMFAMKNEGRHANVYILRQSESLVQIRKCAEGIFGCFAL